LRLPIQQTHRRSTTHTRPSLTALTLRPRSSFFFCNASASTEIYTLSLHDALPISSCAVGFSFVAARRNCSAPGWPARASIKPRLDRKSTRLNSSHVASSYAVFCLKKKNLIGSVQLGSGFAGFLAGVPFSYRQLLLD